MATPAKHPGEPHDGKHKSSPPQDLHREESEQEQDDGEKQEENHDYPPLFVERDVTDSVFLLALHDRHRVLHSPSALPEVVRNQGETDRRDVVVTGD
jgi:hypothetical protein